MLPSRDAVGSQGFYVMECTWCRLMKQQGHIVDEAVCFILLRLCYNRLRESWYPGGYPPRKSNPKASSSPT